MIADAAPVAPPPPVIAPPPEPVVAQAPQPVPLQAEVEAETAASAAGRAGHLGRPAAGEAQARLVATLSPDRELKEGASHEAPLFV